MKPRPGIRFGSALLLAIGISAVPLLAARGLASSFTTLCAFGAASCGSGNPYHPLGSLLKDSSGNLFGTLGWGGIYPNAGAVFEITAAGSYVEIYDFCSAGGTSCTDGETPQGNLIMDTSGNLYGTTSTGGRGHGVVYELMPPATGTTWTIKLRHKFFGSGDGQMPVAGLSYVGQSSGLLYDGTSPLYGTTQQGGIASNGVVFTLTPAATVSWTENVIYEFCNCGSPVKDGDEPSTSVVIDGSGNLYGTARGGNSGGGVLYELSPSGSSWSESVLYNFCPTSVSCPDGESPDANGITLDTSGGVVKVWGTTPTGGDLTYPGGGGVLYEAYAPDGSCTPNTNSLWCERVVYAFCPSGICATGRSPSGGLGPIITNTAPYTLFFTTTNGGANDDGVLFKIRNGAPHDLHDFCSATSCADGNDPNSGLIVDSAGSFYGTTIFGGVASGAGFGTAFRYTP